MEGVDVDEREEALGLAQHAQEDLGALLGGDEGEAVVDDLAGGLVDHHERGEAGGHDGVSGEFDA
ncbi:MAG: hypothetical protein R3F60_01695 [bacterium]